MSTSTALGGGGGVGGALSLMGCVREASPPPQTHHQHHHHHQQHRTFGLGEFPTTQHSVDPLPKESKKRRFHPLRGLRKIFRRKSRGAADARSVSNSTDRDAELARLPREEITMRHPAGRPEEARSRSASELLTDSCDRESVFLRRGGMEDSFVKLRGGAGKLSVSHDSVFPGEVPHTRPLSSLASLATLERRQARKSNEIIEHREYNHHHVAQRHRISLRVLEQIKTVIENRNQLASPDTASIAHAAGERYQQETTENRFAVFERHGERSGGEECQQAKPEAAYESQDGPGRREYVTRTNCDPVTRLVIAVIMVVSHRESSISSNIRAIIEQLNLNPVERRRLIDKTRQDGGKRCKSFPDGIVVESQAPKISIGVYGCKNRGAEYEIPSAIGKTVIAARKIEIERSRPKAETRQRLPAQKREVHTVCQVKKEAPAAPVKREFRAEHANEGKFECQPIVSIGCYTKDTSFTKDTSPNKDESRARSTTAPVPTKTPPKSQRTAIKGEHVARIDVGTIEEKVADAPAVSIKPSYKIEDHLRSWQPDTTASVRIHRTAREPIMREQPRVEDTVEITRSTKDSLDRIVSVAKEDLPQLESASLSHTAAHHRISVRPKNRRPPRRTTSTTSSNGAAPSSPSIPPTIVEDTLDSLEQQEQQQQQFQSTNNAPSPTEPSRAIGVTRKSSSRLSRNSDIFEELESRLPRKPSATSLSPDSLDTTTASRSSAEMTTATEEQQPEVRWVPVARRPSNRISKGSDVFEELEAKLPRRRSSSNRLSKSPDSLDLSPGCWFSKSTEEGFDKLVEYEETAKPVAAVRKLLNPISKSIDRVSKSSDSLEAIEPLASDDSMERRRSSFDFRARKSSKAMSKSSESFDMLEQNGCIGEEIGQELQKRSSVSDINLSRGRRLSKSISKSSESFERIDINDMKDDVEAEMILDDDAPKSRRSSKRMSSESSDNLDMEDRLENRRVRRTPKRIPSTSIVDVIVSGDNHEEEKRPTPTRKPSRLQKSSESSELGSTDTLDSERRNKSSESTETLDSLEKDLEQDRKEEEITDNVIDRREKNDSWTRNVPTTDSETSIGDDIEDSKSLISADNKYYWRQSSEPVSKENLGIQQLLAITIMTRVTDNGNNQRGSVIYPKKKQMSTSQPTSPVAKQEDTKMLFDNLLVSNKNDEDLQNMLNGNISEVSTDTKSFKEKLIMFEKLGK